MGEVDIRSEISFQNLLGLKISVRPVHVHIIISTGRLWTESHRSDETRVLIGQRADVYFVESHGLLRCACVDLPSAGFGAEKCRPTLAIWTQGLAFLDADRGNGVGE